MKNYPPWLQRAASFGLLTLMLVPTAALAATIPNSVLETYMANSAAWHIADADTKAELAAANAAIRKEYGEDCFSYNSDSGVSTITTGGATITNSSTTNGKDTYMSWEYDYGDYSYTETNSCYSKETIEYYLEFSGDDGTMLTAVYNEKGNTMIVNGDFGDDAAQMSAEAESNVIQALLGLTDAETEELQAALERNKQAYYVAGLAEKDALAALEAATAAGDQAAIDAANAALSAAQDDKKAAHSDAENIRAGYGYSGATEGALYDEFGNYIDGSGSGITFTRSEEYTITISSGPNGSASPSGTITRFANTSQIVAFTPDEGYKVSNVIVDGSSVGAPDAYTFHSINSNHSLNVTFERNYFAITASGSNAHGSITPDGVTMVEYGKSQTYSIAAVPGYEIEQVVVDGTVVARYDPNNPGGLPSYSYTFTNVREPHTISATFKPYARLDITGSTLIDVENGTMKSGYGFGIEVGISSSPDVVVSATARMSNGDSCNMEQIGNTLVFVVNQESVIGARKYYVPVATQDGPFLCTVTVTAWHQDDTNHQYSVTETTTQSITISGTMYEDDFTGSSR